MQDFRKLRVWQKAQALAVEIYKYTAGFPGDETDGLRAADRELLTADAASVAR